VGLARTIYIRCIYGIFGREIIKYTVIYGVYIRFWPTLLICSARCPITHLLHAGLPHYSYMQSRTYQSRTYQSRTYQSRTYQSRTYQSRTYQSRTTLISVTHTLLTHFRTSHSRNMASHPPTMKPDGQVLCSAVSSLYHTKKTQESTVQKIRTFHKELHAEGCAPRWGLFRCSGWRKARLFCAPATWNSQNQINHIGPQWFPALLSTSATEWLSNATTKQRGCTIQAQHYLEQFFLLNPNCGAVKTLKPNVSSHHAHGHISPCNYVLYVKHLAMLSLPSWQRIKWARGNKTQTHTHTYPFRPLPVQRELLKQTAQRPRLCCAWRTCCC
jgi:hypothetical protein